MDVCAVTTSVSVDVCGVKAVSSASTVVPTSSVSVDYAVNAAASISTGNSCTVCPDECICVQCGALFKSKQAVHMHQIRVHSNKKVNAIQTVSQQSSSTQQQNSTVLQCH